MRLTFPACCARWRGIVLLGAGQGIGEATARALSQAGARVLCVDKDGDLASKIAREVGGEPCVADVTKRPDMERVFDQARRSFGAVRGVVDIVGMAKLRAPLGFQRCGLRVAIRRRPPARLPCPADRRAPWSPKVAAARSLSWARSRASLACRTK